MIIQPSDLIQELNRALLVRMYHDNTPDSLTTVNILFNYLKVIGSRSTMLCIQSEEKLLQQFQKQKNESHVLKILLLVNVGYNLNIEELVGQETKVVLISALQPISLSNIFSRSVLVYDDNTTILQFLSVFSPENLRRQVYDFVRRESAQQQVPKKSNAQVIKMSVVDHRSQQNKSPYDGVPNRFKKVLEQTQSQSQRYSQQQQHKSHRHGKEGLTAYNDMNMLNADGGDQPSQRTRIYDDEGTVDDLDEINDDEYVEEIEETDTSIRDFINDGGDNSRDLYSPVDYFIVNNQQNQQATAQNALSQQNSAEWTLEDTVTDGLLSQNILINSDIARSQLSAIQADELEQSEELIQDADLEALRGAGQQSEQSAGRRNFYDTLCHLDVVVTDDELNILQEWIKAKSGNDREDVKKRVQNYKKQICFSSPTSGRVGLLILRYSTNYDVQNRVFINDTLFQAFTGIFYRLQISQACNEYVSHFYDQIAPFIPEQGGEMQYLQNDFNLPLLRVLKIIDSISCSYFQFCVPPTLADRGIQPRTNFLLSKLGVKVQTAYLSYAELQPAARREFRIKYQQLRKSLKFKLFTPNFLYKAHTRQVTSQDFAYLLEILPEHFRFLNYQQAYFKLKQIKDSVYHLLPQYLHAQILTIDRHNYQYNNNFIILTTTQRSLGALQYWRLGSYVEHKVVFTRKGSFTNYQSQRESIYFQLGQLEECGCFVPLRLTKRRKDVSELEHYMTTFIHNDKEIFIKYNGVTWLGGFLGAGFITDSINHVNQVITDLDVRKLIESYMQQKLQ